MKEKRKRAEVTFLFIFLLSFLSPSTAQTSSKEPPVYTYDILSKEFLVDRIYKSMVGPTDYQPISLADSGEPELLWIIGYSARPVNAQTTAPLSQEFLCHSNLDLNVQRHQELFGTQKVERPRLFTISQGQTTVRFPNGFGIPILSSEILHHHTQLLNMNVQDQSLLVRHKATLYFVLDRELSRPMKPLYVLSANGAKLIEGKDGYLGIAEATEETKHSGCSVGAPAKTAVASDSNLHDAHGRIFTAHWQVKPGREVNHTLVNDFFDLSFDTTIHYASVHLHPFGESVELRDLTAKKTILKFKAEQLEEGLGLAHVEDISSEEGIPLYKGHHYEIVSVYDNTTPEDQDAMVTLFLYVLDKEWVHSSIR